MIVKRPLAWLAICAVTGTWLGFSTELPQAWLLSLLCFALVATLLMSLIKYRSLDSNIVAVIFPSLIALAVLMVFWFSTTVRIRGNDISSLQAVANVRNIKIDVVGVVAGDPVIYKNRYGKGWVRKFPLRLQEITTDRSTNKCSGIITVKWYGPPPGDEQVYGNSVGVGPGYGEQWAMRGKIRLPQYKNYHGNYILITGDYSSRRISVGIFSTIAQQCLAARRSSAEKLSVGIEEFPEYVGLLRAILLGYRSNLKGDMRELFAQVGTLHIFAVSGLHVGIICSLIIFVLSVLTVPRTHWVLLLAPLLIAYTFAIGARPSAVRACIMAIIYFGAPLVWRKADSISTVSLAAMLILAFAPHQLFQIGFIYSFVVVLGLILLYPVIHHALSLGMRRLGIFTRVGELTVEPLFWQKDNMQIEDESKWIVIVRKFMHYLVSLLALSCAAWLASAPITAYFFGNISPIALIANVVVIPLAFLVVITGALSLLLGYCLTILADIFNHANLAIIALLVNSMQWIGKVPGAFFEIDKVPLWFVFLWYALLLVIVYLYKKRSKQVSDFSNQ